MRGVGPFRERRGRFGLPVPQERRGRDDQRGHRLPGPAEGDARKVHEPDGHKGQLVEPAVGRPPDQDRRRSGGRHLLRRRDRRGLVQGGRVLRDEVVPAAQPVLQDGLSRFSVPADQLVRAERDARRDADGRVAARHDHQREGVPQGWTHLGAENARPVHKGPADPQGQGRRQVPPGHPLCRR